MNQPIITVRDMNLWYGQTPAPRAAVSPPS